MLQNIREIGIFMVAAQAVVHFAPARQYEKYVKSISGVVVLLLFLKPFVQLAGGEWKTPSDILAGLESTAMRPDLSTVSSRLPAVGPEGAVKRRAEEKIEEILNRELEEDPCLVKRVELHLTKEEERSEEESPVSVEIVIGEREADDDAIAVEEITVGEKQGRQDDAAETYRLRFARLLEMPQEYVEVRWDG